MIRMPLGHFLAAICLTASLPGLAAASDLALVGARLYDGTGAEPLDDSVVLVTGGRIECVGTAADCNPEQATETLDLRGRYLTPGLIDAHVHFSQTGWLDGRPDSRITPPQFDYEALQAALRSDQERWHHAYLCSGITAVLDVGGLPWTLDYEQAAEGRSDRARVRAAGPLVTHASNTALRAGGADTFLPMGSDEEALRSVAQLHQWGSRYVKVWYLDPAPAQREALDRRLHLVGEEANRLGMRLIVHATELRNATVALEAGAFMLVHSVDDALVDQRFLDLLLEKHALYAPTLHAGRNWTRALMSVALGLPAAIDDPEGCVDTETRRLIAEAPELKSYLPDWGRDFARLTRRYEGVGREDMTMMMNLKTVYAAGAVIATATDAGNPLTLHGVSIHEEMESMQQAGLAPADVITMSTARGAQAMLRDDIGTIERGKLADILVLAEDPGQDVRAFRARELLLRGGVVAWRRASPPGP